MMYKKRVVSVVGSLLVLSLIFTGCGVKQAHSISTVKVIKAVPTSTEQKQTYLVEANKIILDTGNSRARIIEIESDFQRAIDVPELVSSEIDSTKKDLKILKTMAVYSDYKEGHGYLIKSLEYYIEWWKVDLDSANKKINVIENKSMARKITVANDKATINIRKVFNIIPQVNK